MEKANKLISEVKAESRGMRKGNVDIFPQSLILYCNTLEIHSDGTPQHTRIFINNKEAKGIYSIHVNLNTIRPMKIEMGIFMDDFNFEFTPKKK